MMTILDCGPLFACQDCAVLIANDDTSGAPEGHREAFATWQATYGDDAHLALGDECSDFSARRCDGCGSGLAGYRHELFALA